METKTLKDEAFTGFFWKFGERFLAQVASFLVSIVLTRLLSPSDYGLIAMVLVFITIADVFVSSGFATALIQKKDSNETDFSSVFYCSLGISIIVYVIVYIFAPVIANFYQESQLIILIRVFALRIPISVYNTIQHAYVSRNLLFKKFFFSTLFGTLLSGIVGIILAYCGAGVWALVAQYFVNTIVDTIVLAFTITWHPKLIFSWESTKQLIGYGSRVLIADLSGTIFIQLRSFIIGKVYSPADLAFYNKGLQVPSLISNNVTQTVSTVLFPVMSNRSSNKDIIKQMTRKAIQDLSFVVFPLMFVLAAVAKQLVVFLFTEKWIECVPFIQILSISSSFGMLSNISIQTVKAIGKSDVLVKLEIIKKPVFLILLILGIKAGTIMVAMTMLIYELYGCSVNMFQLKLHINYSLKEQLSDSMPPLVLSLCLLFLLQILQLPFQSSFLVLIIKTLIGMATYVFGSFLFKIPAFPDIIMLIKAFRKRRRA